MVWSSRYEEFGPKCTVPTVKHGSGFVMFHGERSYLLSANIGRESVTINTAIRTWDELLIYA